jgi:type I restriction enzyme S subunit
MSFPRYELYKDSGVEWLGEVPEHWELKRLILLASINDDALPEDTDPDFEMDYLDIGSVVPGQTKLAATAIKFGSAPSRARRMVRNGDILISTVRTYLRAIAPIVHPPDNLIASTGFAVVRPKNGYSSIFLNYAVQSSNFIEEVIARSTGVSYPAINAHELGFIKLPLPQAKQDQECIGQFIATETAKIDALIEEQRRLIELLKEKRQAVISHAVTKGLNPEVSLRDSRVASFGFIPSHWSIRKVHALARVGNGSTPSRERIDYWDGGEYPWLSSTVVNQEEVNQADQFVTELALKECHLPKISPPAVLIGITGQGKTRGMATTLRFEATINQHMAAVVPRNTEIDIEFFRRVFDMLYIDLRTDSEGGGSTKGAITCEQIQNLRIALPPITEQIEIASWIQARNEEFVALVEQAESAIGLLQERRSALISAAVTGKIDVRNYTPKEAA